jgi:RNA 3'-terminal phosphate cyclase (ATP)
VTLLFHAVVYPLALAPAPSEVEIVGGTYVPNSPGFHDLTSGWAPWLSRFGVSVELESRCGGFYPAGGGELRARLPGSARPQCVAAMDRGGLARVQVVSGIGNLPLHIAERQRDRALERLRRERERLQGARVESELVPLRSRSPGTFVTLVAEAACGPTTFTALGAKGKPAERVADEACDGLFAFLATRGTVDAHLADQLVLPMALADGESSVRVERVTRHLITNLEVVQRFLGIEWRLDAREGEEGVLAVRGRFPADLTPR